jgi:hydrogenase expression/formation protein HypD
MIDRIQKAQRTMEEACSRIGRRVNIMEVCGTHTVAIFRQGIKSTLDPAIRLISGPGCPVCVTDSSYIDTALRMAERPEVLIATYGDMMRVPGKESSLEAIRARSSNVTMVLSATDAVELARRNPDRMVVFVAVGFETTTPATAVAVKEAKALGLQNFLVYSAHKLVVPAMEALLGSMNTNIDAFLCPGHVSVIIGSDAYKPVVARFGKPCVVAGFEAVQIVEGLAEICRQLAAGKAEVSSVYNAAVTRAGNATAWAIVQDCFKPADGLWRGVGLIPASTLVLRDEYRQFDALTRLGMTESRVVEHTPCRCGEVLCGLIDPPQCVLFGNRCTPDTPVGPCMVSSEGSCAAWYKYSRRKKASS